MKKEFKVQAISEKVDVLEVNGQEYSYRCLHNCPRDIWSGNSSSRTRGCNIEVHHDAYMTVKY
ncbi:hypothetical protein C671_0341 [[Clostridium] bifermentans ATCC 19299]|uniref:Uncharacterized protein n=1 Tax=Paraclostridium bifermentans TaxID=1490 RepID=A0A5P3XGV1_PARBF|nr:hypothetical protein [Paraclostridium bifermentans]EQK48727.1 hypothetical protein C671_0341 [[Clostridium] bifermentans ATCC 19299] [Paraclostridium bifermentans ATCC 19299]MDV8113637.1 hypothetical protein [Bacillus sp. BAU-SS-2023]QEZ69462.1 hypothetical protein D4A35_11420 [Paraclostridium bifermentans]QEZ69588.1 hypothetical protein D4A35_12115 [Paraclostridium bifermentans]